MQGAFINRHYRSPTHLSTSDLYPEHGSVPTNCPTNTWIALFHQLYYALPFWTDSLTFPMSRIHLIPSRSRESFFVNYRLTESNQIVFHYYPRDRRFYNSFYSLVPASDSPRLYFISWALLVILTTPPCLIRVFGKLASIPCHNFGNLGVSSRI